MRRMRAMRSRQNAANWRTVAGELVELQQRERRREQGSAQSHEGADRIGPQARLQEYCRMGAIRHRRTASEGYVTHRKPAHNTAQQGGQGR
jgi:hypothetical protein